MLSRAMVLVIGYVDEVRDGHTTSWEVTEEWDLECAAGTTDWFPKKIRRLRRRPLLKPPVLWHTARSLYAFPIMHPDIRLGDEQVFQERLPDYSHAEFQKTADLVFMWVIKGISKGSLLGVERLMTVRARGELKTALERLEVWGYRRKISRAEVEGKRIVRVSSDAIDSSVTLRIYGKWWDRQEDTSNDDLRTGAPETTGQFVVYWTFMRRPGMSWRLHCMDTDETWVV
jgi:hypothetical protein